MQVNSEKQYLFFKKIYSYFLTYSYFLSSNGNFLNHNFTNFSVIITVITYTRYIARNNAQDYFYFTLSRSGTLYMIIIKKKKTVKF